MTDININAISEALNNKADRDINNLTNSGYAKGSGLGMPSSKYVDLTLGASGTTYTAPANGWFAFRGEGTVQNNSRIEWRCGINDKYQGLVCSCNQSLLLRGSIPILKGQQLHFWYANLVTSTYHFTFIYAEGDQ